MTAKPKILLISQGDFSGVTPALTAALRRAGCEVISGTQSLRELGLLRYPYGLWMKASARLIYGRDANLLLERTYAAYVSRSRVSKALVDRHPDVDVVLLINANSSNYRGRRPSRPRFALYTDYMNLLSKGLPDYGFQLDERKTYPRWNSLEREALAEQDHIFVMGSHVKPALELSYGVDPDKITVVGSGPGLDLDIVRDGQVKNTASRRILFVGKLAEVKGLDVLLRAFPRVREIFPDAVLDVVTGKPVSGPGVVFHGNIDLSQLGNLFYSANVFAMPAYKEPLGLVFLEAMLSKAACIGTTTGSMPEIIREGETGYLVQPGDHIALAERICDMLREPVRTQRMAELGYASAKAYWHWDGVVQRMLARL
ncbi:MAG: glycosyltransferase family 4 protein [Pseudomonadota bacterium]